MNRNISEDIKREVLSKYMYTRMTIKKIAKTNSLSYEEVISILDEYERIHGHIERNLTEINPISKSQDKSSTDKKEQILKERHQIIYNLREQGLSYRKIVEELDKKGIKVSLDTVRTVCKKIYDSKGETEPKAKTGNSKKIIDDNNEQNKKIYELREKGLSYRKIVAELELLGIKMSLETVRKRCKEIYKLKKKEEPEARKKTVDKEEIYILREQGLSYVDIVEQLRKQGVEISENVVSIIYKEMCTSKGQVESKVTYGKSKKRVDQSQELNEKIYELREKRLSYGKIAEELELQGIKIGIMAICKRCKTIYKLKGKSEPELIKKKVEKEYIYTLREQGLSYVDIAEQLEKQGIEITSTTVRRICKEIYTAKGEIEPMVSGGIKRITDKNPGLKERIYELREKGLTYREIVEELEIQGIKISETTLYKICTELYNSKEKINKQQLAKSILNLMTTKKATLEQVQIIADYYGVDLEKTMNSLEER